MIYLLKGHMAAKSDGLSSFLFTDDGEKLPTESTKLGLVWKNGRLLRNWHGSAVVPIYKGYKSAYISYRGIDFVSITSELIVGIIIRLPGARKGRTLGDHAGFRPGRGVQAAFDSVDHVILALFY